MRMVSIGILLLSFAGSAAAQDLRVATWNIGEGTVEGVEARAAAIRQAGTALNPDVLVLQEVTSFAAVQRIGHHIGMGAADLAISNFSRDTGEVFTALEVAVVSKVPIRSVTEFDTKRDAQGPITVSRTGEVTVRLRDAAGTVPDQLVAEAPPLPGLSERPGPRGFLRVELETGLVVYAVHLKSSRIGLCFAGKSLVDNLRSAARDLERVPSGQELAQRIRGTLQTFREATYSQEVENAPAVTEDALRSARQREATIAAVAVEVGKDAARGLDVVVAGDFNTPLNEPCKTGSDLTVDHTPVIRCSDKITAPTCSADGYDETHALLAKGLVGGLAMRPLDTPAMGRTFADPAFIDSPIDHIYVVGPGAGRFSDAQRVGTAVQNGPNDWTVFGSDHYPVVTVWRR